MRFAIYTLGCKVNQYESQAMQTVLEGRGHTLVPFEEEAELYLINTCSVTAVSDKKSRQTIRRTRREHPNAVIAVCGCYAQTSPEQVAELGVDFVSGTGDRLAFLEQVQQEAVRRQRWMQVDDPFRRTDFEVLPAGGLEGRTRAMLKVQDGCRNFCTYCIIPYTRGRSAPSPWTPPWSRPGSWRRRATGRSSSPALRSPPGEWSGRTAPPSST
ncbi:MAG: hypothetical protein LUF81_06185 [Clostridiales bacterium]|nr:hypothetical protein [Clostridiales bacterium]